MKKYSCNLIYKYAKEDNHGLLTDALKVLGFEPKYMDIFFDEFENIHDVSYDEEHLFKSLKRNPAKIRIKHDLYDENKSNNWFAISIDNTAYNISQFTWSNSNLDFLVTSTYFNSFLNSKNLICGYCFDQIDSIQQSNANIDSFKEYYPSAVYKTVKNFIGDDVVDVSEHWGRCEIVCGLSFLAAPLMWFKEEFYKIISKEELLEFKYSKLIKHMDFEYVFVTLFDIHDSPATAENRNKQKEYWKFFDLQNRIVRYKQEHSVDFVSWLKEKAKSKKK